MQSQTITRGRFVVWVRNALNHLFDLAHLQNHPLTALLVQPGALQPGQEMRRLLLHTIGSFRPEAGVSSDSAAWRMYRILELRYLEGLNPPDVMEEVALGKSQYFREQARSVEAVTSALWVRWQEHATAQEATATSNDHAHDDQQEYGDTTQMSRAELARVEVERLRRQAKWEDVDLAALFQDLAPVIEELAKAKRVITNEVKLDHLTLVRSDRTLMRQAILSAITYGLDVARNGRLIVESIVQDNEKGIRILAEVPSATYTDSSNTRIEREGVGLEIGARLMAALAGRFTVTSGQPPNGNWWWEARLTWEHCNRQPLLMVVDDNEQFVDLFRRYLAHRDWQVIGLTNGATLHTTVADLQPAVIVLDVMMPQQDGWELLRALRSKENSQSIPVVVCSVLNEPQLALALGASAYLPKPVTQEALLTMLDRWS